MDYLQRRWRKIGVLSQFRATQTSILVGITSNLPGSGKPGPATAHSPRCLLSKFYLVRRAKSYSSDGAARRWWYHGARVFWPISLSVCHFVLFWAGLSVRPDRDRNN